MHQDLLAAHSMYREMFLTMSGTMHDRLHDLSCLADVAAALTSASKESLQRILEQLNVIVRCVWLTPVCGTCGGAVRWEPFVMCCYD